MKRIDLGWMAMGGLALGVATIVQAQTLSPDQLFQQGITQYQARQFEAAIVSLQQALNLYRQQQNPQGELLSLELIGLNYQALGAHNLAIEAFQQELKLAEKLGNQQIQANIWGNLGVSYYERGQYSLAMNAYERSRDLRQSLGDRQGLGQILVNLANVQIQLGNYKAADALLGQALALATQVNDRLNQALLLNSRGTIASSQGQYEDAARLYRRSLAIGNERLADKSLGAVDQIRFQQVKANALNSLGSIAQFQKQYAQAIDSYQQVLAIAQTIKDSRLEAVALGSIGLSYLFLNQYSQALKYQQQSWEVVKTVGDRATEALALNNWGYTLWQSGKLAEAEQKYLTALDILDSLRMDLTDQDKVSIFDTQVEIFSRLQQIQVALKQPEAALETAERGRARAFVELLSRRTRGQGAGAIPTSQLPIAPINRAQIQQIARERQATLVEYAIITDDRFLRQGKRRGEDRELFIWVVPPSGKVVFRRVNLTASLPRGKTKLLPSETKPVSFSTLIESVRLSIGVDTRGFSFQEQPEVATLQPAAVVNPELQKLHQVLIAPIADLLPEDPKQPIVFMPQRDLFLVPFAALQDEAGKFLIESHTILTAPAIQILQLTPQRPAIARTGEMLVVGNPTMPIVQFDLNSPAKQLTSLPGAEKEAQTIAKLLNTEALTGDRATEALVKQRLSQARIIHLATHGLLTDFYVDGAKSEIPGAIALAPSVSEDGLLSTQEILGLTLSQAELVVLSACDTGGGDTTGDGVIGLSRALITAGVPSVLVSLWKVPDEPTAFLMTEFYRNLLQNPDRAQAMRQAMLKTLKQYPDPKAWAAFTLMGNPQ
ncbi:hypothetical protein BST81_21045 [Leptolyngbya sp. 'hensonii']|uniref:CHAT domain-containing protein n=1 Tax=Leptolyngbya sp. 'hensonii' TaxID=1922337 RepID=UPI00094F5FD9|nr:CHAT domain-containing tetratricopeptide repeat protein [Leptolyngbya sp. 'hensonii']OLP16467.1 hypothetical protein BST81_21045 [Leptolyngbya sp. 'hensonii']